MILFFDTETTGMVDFNAPCSAEHQPDCVQLAALLCNDDGSELGSMNTLVKPNGWTISPEAQSVHGITLERCQAEGVPAGFVLSKFNALLRHAHWMVGHNINFDLKVLDVMRHRYCADELGFSEDTYEVSRGKFFKPYECERVKFCTMLESTDICKIPSRRGYKWPRLTEAHKILCGIDMQGAHDAMCDVRACKAVFFALRKLGLA